MKKILLVFMILVLFIVSCATAKPEATTADVSTQDGLDVAIRNASDYINKNVPRGSKLVILNIKSTYAPLSEYIIDVLTGNVVNDRVFTVVDRANLALIQQEMDFQLSGEVSDESLQTIGQKLGAQTIVSGSITPFGNLWRLTIRSLGVEDATVLGLYNENIPGSSTLMALTSGPETVEPVRNLTVASNAGPALGTPPATSITQAASEVVTPASVSPLSGSTVYNVGDTGPAGGIIFYDKGNNSGGWQYLEAAPVSTEFSAIYSSITVDYYFKTESAIGTGKTNTMRLIEASTAKGTDLTAGGKASSCYILVYNNYDDWFLPSTSELDLIYKNLKTKNIGGFKDGWYWSSTIFVDANYPFPKYYTAVSFLLGSQRRDLENVNSYIRAIRQF